MNEKKEVPMWAIVTSSVVLLGFVAFLFVRGASGGDASKATLDEIRGNQRKFSTSSPGAPPENPTAQK